MDLQRIYTEEDLFPKQIAAYKEREYGLLFCNEANKDSYDSNHAVIFRDKTKSLDNTLDDIVSFYMEKGITPRIYQSIFDDGYFLDNRNTFAAHGFDCWSETQNFMVLCERNNISPNPEIEVQRVTEWDDIYGTEIFEKSGEPWEIGVSKNALKNGNTLFFVSFYDGMPIGMVNAHVTNGVCRVDYMLVSPEHRNKGAGRAMMYAFAEYCRINDTGTCFLWYDNETAGRIYYEAGFRTVAVKQTARAGMRISKK